MKKSKLTVLELCLFGMLAALTFALKFVMSGLPNIEPVSLMILVMATVFGLRSLFCVYTYVLLEILVYGFGPWNFNYFYIWAVLALAAYLMKGMKGRLSWAILSGFFGLVFGALCAPVDVFIGGGEYAIAKWVSGIPYDLLHCAGNFIIALLLFPTLRELMEKLRKQLHPRSMQ